MVIPCGFITDKPLLILTLTQLLQYRQFCRQPYTSLLKNISCRCHRGQSDIPPRPRGLVAFCILLAAPGFLQIIYNILKMSFLVVAIRLMLRTEHCLYLLIAEVEYGSGSIFLPDVLGPNPT